MGEEPKKMAVQAVCEAAKLNANLTIMKNEPINLVEYALGLCEAIEIIEGRESLQLQHQ